MKEIGEKLGQAADDSEMNELLERQAELFEQMEHSGWLECIG